MEIKPKIENEISREYLKSRNNISLVIDYLEKLKAQQPSVEVNNDCIRLLRQALSTQAELYLEFNEIPIHNAELRLQNYILTLQKETLEKELKESLKLKV
jgi:hypothetical protein